MAKEGKATLRRLVAYSAYQALSDTSLSAAAGSMDETTREVFVQAIANRFIEELNLRRNFARVNAQIERGGA